MIGVSDIGVRWVKVSSEVFSFPGSARERRPRGSASQEKIAGDSIALSLLLQEDLDGFMIGVSEIDVRWVKVSRRIFRCRACEE